MTICSRAYGFSERLENCSYSTLGILLYNEFCMAKTEVLTYLDLDTYLTGESLSLCYGLVGCRDTLLAVLYF